MACAIMRGSFHAWFVLGYGANRYPQFEPAHAGEGHMVPSGGWLGVGSNMLNSRRREPPMPAQPHAVPKLAQRPL